MSTSSSQGRAATAQETARRLEIRATRDRALLLSVMEQDRIFAAYAIADMDDTEFARTRWGVALDGETPVALAMEYRGISPQHLFIMGDGDGIRGILRDVIRTGAAYTATKPESVPALTERYRSEPPTDMIRMVVDRATFRPVVGEAVRLDVGDTRHLNRLYELGLTAWLPPEAVDAGIYYGVRRGTRLIAAAGTHVISPTYGLAAVGNVYTNRDYRGQGLAKIVTSAVTEDLLRDCPEVVLNVRADNPPALAAYRALGYREHTHFEERLVSRRASLWDSIVGPIRQYLSRPRSDG
jgi:ribosomal protein S18 acetylase RimI-like enzyme